MRVHCTVTVSRTLWPTLSPLTLALPVTVTVSETGATCRLGLVVLPLLEPVLVVEEVLLGVPAPPPQLKLERMSNNDSRAAAVLHLD